MSEKLKKLAGNGETFEKEEKVEKPKDVSTTGKNLPSNNQVPYAVQLLTKMKEDFTAANAGLGLDYVYMGQWLVINKKGQFVERDNPDVKYGDRIEVVIGMGEERFTLWGKQGSKEQGTLIIAEKTRELAENKFMEIAHTLDDSANYAPEDIQSRYLASVIPVDTLEDEVPKIYLLSMPQTAKLAYGKWAFSLFNGQFAKDGFPRGTSVPSVVTAITTIEKDTGDFSYVTMEFEAVKKFELGK
jgi:hypothetical protein